MVKSINKIRHLAILCLSFILYVGSAWCSDEVTVGPVDIALEPILSRDWISYIQNGDLYLKTIEAAPIMIRGGKDAAATIHSPDLAVSDNSVFMTWIEKRPDGNRAMFFVSRDRGKTPGEFIELAAKTKATRVMLLVSAKGKVFVLEVSSGKEPEVFINISLDNAHTFKRIPLETKGIETLYHPSALVIKDLLYIFFVGVKGDRKFICMNSYEVPAMNMKDSSMIQETGSTSFIESFSLKDAPVVVFKTMREGKFVLQGVKKRESTWEPFSLKGAEGLDVARMDYHVWDDGRVLVVFSGEERGRFKQRIYAAVSDDGAGHWDIKRIDHKEFDNTRSWLPRMAVDGERIAIVWEDARNIRSGIRLKLSPDRGNTWTERDVPVSNSAFYAFRPRISFANNVFYIAWQRFRSDERRVTDLAALKLGWGEAEKMTTEQEKGLSLAEKEALLRERVNAYWKGMLDKDLRATYELHDPFYRARIPFNSYASQRGPMVYQAYTLENMTIEGNVAEVKIKVTYDVPKLQMLGKETSIASKEVVAEDTYLFLDGTWYRRFVDAMSGGSSIDY
ncbi:MAG: hypothetical protein ACLPX5_13965 [Dissulfurispiraceae bacterium]